MRILPQRAQRAQRVTCTQVLEIWLCQTEALLGKVFIRAVLKIRSRIAQIVRSA